LELLRLWYHNYSGLGALATYSRWQPAELSCSYQLMLHFEVLQALLMPATIPTPVLRLSAPFILRTFTEKTVTALATRKVSPLDVNPLRKRVLVAIGLSKIIASETQAPTQPDAPPMTVPPQAIIPLNNAIPWTDQAAVAIRTALNQAGSGQVPVLDVARCILTTSPAGFLETLWRELLASSVISGPQVAHRFAVVVLTAPRIEFAPGLKTWLLPLFLRVIVPRIVAIVDDQESQEHSPVELLAAIVSSSLTAALYLERAPPARKHQAAGGAETVTLARRFAQWLHEHEGGTCKALSQRLASIPDFRVHFPVFAA
jgi:hypothetical protein